MRTTWTIADFARTSVFTDSFALPVLHTILVAQLGRLLCHAARLLLLAQVTFLREVYYV